MSTLDCLLRPRPFRFEYKDQSTAVVTMDAPVGKDWELAVSSPDKYADEHGIDAVWRRHLKANTELSSMRLQHPEAPDNAFWEAHGDDATAFVDHMNTLRERNRKTVYDDARSVIAAAEVEETGTNISVTSNTMRIVKGKMRLDYKGGAWQPRLYMIQEEIRQSITAKRDLVIHPDARSRYDAKASANQAAERNVALDNIKTGLDFHERAHNKSEWRAASMIKLMLVLTP